MDNKSKTLIAIFGVIILVSVFLTYKRSFVDQDFLITQEEAEELEEGQIEEESTEEES